MRNCEGRRRGSQSASVFWAKSLDFKFDGLLGKVNDLSFELLSCESFEMA